MEYPVLLTERGANQSKSAFLVSQGCRPNFATELEGHHSSGNIRVTRLTIAVYGRGFLSGAVFCAFFCVLCLPVEKVKNSRVQ